MTLATGDVRSGTWGVTAGASTGEGANGEGVTVGTPPTPAFLNAVKIEPPVALGRGGVDTTPIPGMG